MTTLTILSRDAAHYEQLLKSTRGPLPELVQIEKKPEDIDCSRVEILLSEPDLALQIVPHCDNLVWLQSTWAGNAPLVKLAKQDYLLTAARGIFGTAIREYVMAYLLYFIRSIDIFHPRLGGLQSEKPRNWSQPKVDTLMHKRIGILGAGSMASSLLPALKMFGATVVGLNRSGTSSDAYDELYPISDLLNFANGLDFVISLLPDTPQTQGLIDKAFLAQLPPHCVLINAGRGNTVVEQALLSALNARQLKAAVLDVFEQEPLPEAHPYWENPYVWITQHTAAISNPKDVFRVFIENYQRWRANTTLQYSIDFKKGY
ncbi:D-2-hydroxyacid dehydrogenase [Alteromonas facilis]|uniref:D-2-hydroxyacid dehydrogenase n=1 Tax=Alteromonas facilis TaxID=2048004 RepID=UPI000C28FD54|nr:D-2-hydroxyacid dehydrogenase [Alteromonas facilis]